MGYIKVECSKCSGAGVITAFSHIINGICFDCEGKGYIVIEQSKIKKTYHIYIQMDAEDATRKLWTYEKGISEKEVLKKVQKIASRGCYAKWIDTIEIKEVNHLLLCSKP